MKALGVQWDGDVDFPRGDLPLLKTMTEAVSQSATKWGAASCKCSHEEDSRRGEIGRVNAERRREKDPIKRKTLSIALYRARQKARRAQEIRSKEATQMVVPSRLNAPPQRTRAPVLEHIDEDGNIEKIEDVKGRTEIVHKHFNELFTDPADEVLPEWIKKRWPKEILEALPMIDGERVREITWAFRKRTSCAEDHVVVVYLCLSSPSDEHHPLHSCLGTGARVGNQNKFCLHRASLAHPVSSITLCCCWCFWWEQYHDTATSGIEYLDRRNFDRLCPVFAGKHVTVTRDGRFCARFRDGGSTLGSGARRGSKPWQENGK